ncbi:MAG: AbrB/MazE/SpoVT family DNA-binding domain-containing protein [Cyanobacteria bacterium]|nr:AbrB/MazE/SpoVT family DNA-binding domain-containing protein [Cyanobacteriota bacterium]
MEIHLKKWGNSLGLRIPHQLAASLGFDETVTLELLEGDRALVLRKKYVPPSLDALLASIPDGFQYADDVADFVGGAPVGQELI